MNWTPAVTVCVDPVPLASQHETVPDACRQKSVARAPTHPLSWRHGAVAPSASQAGRKLVATTTPVSGPTLKLAHEGQRDAPPTPCVFVGSRVVQGDSPAGAPPRPGFSHMYLTSRILPVSSLKKTAAA